MNDKGLLIGIAVGVFLIGLGIGYGIFSAPLQQQLQEQQKQITSLQAEVSSLKTAMTIQPSGTPTTGTQTPSTPDFPPVIVFTQASQQFMQGAAMMQQGANMMLQAQDIIAQNTTQGNIMMNVGSSMMQQGFDMMQQASKTMQQTKTPPFGTGPMMQGFNNMMQYRQNMLDAANTMMQARQTMLNAQKQGMMGQQNMPMMQGINSMSQATALMQKHMSNMWQAQGMMGINPMMGVGGFGFMGPMMMWNPLNQTSFPSFMGMMNIRTVQPLTIDNVEKEAQDFVKSFNNPNLAVKDIMEFERNFYFIVYEKDTGIGAIEMLVWKDTAGTMMTGIMHPEPGPNMMWNAKYSMMQFAQPTTEMAITKDKARSLAQAYLDTSFPGTKIEDVDPFYGYYTVHTEKDGKISGMLSVNGFTGQIWYHWWHGQFIQEK